MEHTDQLRNISVHASGERADTPRLFCGRCGGPRPMAGCIQRVAVGAPGVWSPPGPLLRDASRADHAPAMGDGARRTGKPNVGIYRVWHREFHIARDHLRASPGGHLRRTAEENRRLRGKQF